MTVNGGEENGGLTATRLWGMVCRSNRPSSWLQNNKGLSYVMLGLVPLTHCMHHRNAAPQKCCTTKMLQTLAVILHDLSTLQLPVKPVTVHMDKPQY